MGQCLTRLFNKSPPVINVGLLGLDNAGKTTLLYNIMDYPQNQEIIPTIGFNMEIIRLQNYLLKIWDVGGGKPKSRALWRHYNEKTTKAIIYVIDTSDTKRLSHALKDFKWLWLRAELSKAVFLIFANKQDLKENALTGREIADLLDLKSSTKYHPWFVQESCALTGQGVHEGLQKLVKMYEEQHRPKFRNRSKRNILVTSL